MTTIRRATPTDVGRLSVTAMRAFADDPVMRWLMPDDDYFDPPGESFRTPMIRWVDLGHVWCTDDGAAVAVWIPPGRPESEVDVQPPPRAPDAVRIEKFQLLVPLLDAHQPTEEHWYLQLLATHPDWQRQGLGAQLMEVMFERADEDGLPCYLETETVENVAYYRRHGFEVTGEWDVPSASDGLVGPHMWGMLRSVP